MHTSITSRVAAPAESVFSLAAAVEDWPRILPHYRWVHVLARTSPTERVVEMAARRHLAGPFTIPLWWRSLQRLDAERGRIEFEHIDGVTRGMQVVWTIEAVDGGTLASIHHAFTPGWPLPDGLVHAVVGQYFVNAVARRTLRRIGEIAELGKTGP